MDVNSSFSSVCFENAGLAAVPEADFESGSIRRRPKHLSAVDPTVVDGTNHRDEAVPTSTLRIETASRAEIGAAHVRVMQIRGADPR